MPRSVWDVHRWWFHRTARLLVRPARARLGVSRRATSLAIPKCSWCKRVRLAGTWTCITLPEDSHITGEPTTLTHGICPACDCAFRAAAHLGSAA